MKSCAGSVHFLSPRMLRCREGRLSPHAQSCVSFYAEFREQKDKDTARPWNEAVLDESVDSDFLEGLFDESPDQTEEHPRYHSYSLTHTLFFSLSVDGVDIPARRWSSRRRLRRLSGWAFTMFRLIAIWIYHLEQRTSQHTASNQTRLCLLAR